MSRTGSREVAEPRDRPSSRRRRVGVASASGVSLRRRRRSGRTRTAAPHSRRRHLTQVSARRGPTCSGEAARSAAGSGAAAAAGRARAPTFPATLGRVDDPACLGSVRRRSRRGGGGGGGGLGTGPTGRATAEDNASSHPADLTRAAVGGGPVGGSQRVCGAVPTTGT